MKAQDIRNIRGEQDTKEGVFYLKEIAAQFADLNQNLERFMAAMNQLSMAIAELNTQLIKSDKGGVS